MILGGVPEITPNLGCVLILNVNGKDFAEVPVRVIVTGVSSIVDTALLSARGFSEPPQPQTNSSKAKEINSLYVFYVGILIS